MCRTHDQPYFVSPAEPDPSESSGLSLGSAFHSRSRTLTFNVLATTNVENWLCPFGRGRPPNITQL